MLSYDNETTETIKLTESLIPEEKLQFLRIEGHHIFPIFYEGLEIILDINMYSNYSYDKNIAVVNQIIEKRSSKEETKTDYEKSEYDIYFYIKRITSSDIVDLFVEVGVETAEGINYYQSDGKKSLDRSVTICSTIKFTNTNEKKVAVNEIEINEKTSEITHIDRIPKKLHIKIFYSVVRNGSYAPKELKYTIDYTGINTNGFEEFEERYIEYIKSNQIAPFNDCLAIKLTRRVVEETDASLKYDEFFFCYLNIQTNKLPTNVKIENVKIEVVGEISNKSKVNTEYFSDYIALFTYEGTLVENIDRLRSVKVNIDYKVEKIYFRILVDLENGEKLNYNYYVLVSKLR